MYLKLDYETSSEEEEWSEEEDSVSTSGMVDLEDLGKVAKNLQKAKVHDTVNLFTVCILHQTTLDQCCTNTDSTSCVRWLS